MSKPHSWRRRHQQMRSQNPRRCKDNSLGGPPLARRGQGGREAKKQAGGNRTRRINGDEGRRSALTESGAGAGLASMMRPRLRPGRAREQPPRQGSREGRSVTSSVGAAALRLLPPASSGPLCAATAAAPPTPAAPLPSAMSSCLASLARARGGGSSGARTQPAWLVAPKHLSISLMLPSRETCLLGET